MPKIPEVPEVSDYNDGIGCTVCKVIVNIIKYEIKYVNATEEAIKKTVKSLCKLYPIKAAQDAVS